MQVSVENTSSLGRRLTISVPAERVRSAVDARTREVTKTARLDGFRTGKIPAPIIQQKFGAQIRQEAVSKVIEASLPEAIKEQALEPAGSPIVERVRNLHEEGKDLEYVVSFEILPEVILPEFSSIKVEKFQVEIKPTDIENIIDKLKTRFANWTKVERPAHNEDRVTVDYTSTLNGKPYENNSGKDVVVELGSNFFIEGFETGLIGAAVGDTRALDLHFPSDWRIEKLAGKPVHFSITIKLIEEKHLAGPGEIAKHIGAKSPDMDAIRQLAKEDMDRQSEHLINESLRKQILDQLLALCPIPLPKALVQNEMAALHEDLHRRKGDKAHDACNHQGLEAEANRRVASSLILRNIIKLEKLTPDAGQVKAKISEIAKAYGNAEFVENMYYESEELISGVQNTVLVDQAIDAVLAKATVTPKLISVDELFKQAP